MFELPAAASSRQSRHPRHIAAIVGAGLLALAPAVPAQSRPVQSPSSPGASPQVAPSPGAPTPGAATARAATRSLAATGGTPQTPAVASHSPFPPRFAVDHWTTDQGLPSNTIPELIQSSDGYLWMVASGAVVRFDGRRFVTFSGSGATPPDTSPMRAFALVAGAGDTVWAVMSEPSAGTRVVMYTGGRSEVVATAQGTHGEILRDGKGSLWLGTYPGLRRLEGGRLVDSLDVGLSMSDPEYGSENGPAGMLDRFGDLWVLDAQRDSIGRIGSDGPHFVAHSRAPVLLTRPSTGDVLFETDRSGAVDVTDRDGTVLARFRRRTGLIARLVDRRGRLWVSAGSRLEVHDSLSLEPLTVIDLPPATSRITGMLEDREGNLWARTNTDGLYRIRELPAHVLGAAEGIQANHVLMVAPGRNGSTLAVDRGGSLYRVVGGRVQSLHSPQVVSPGWFGRGGAVRSVAEDRSGNLWLSWWDDRRKPEYYLIARRTGQADIEFPIMDDFRAIVEDPRGDGTIWAGSRNFVYRVRQTGSSYVLSDSIRVHDAMRGLTFDSTGALWIAADSALVRISGTTVQEFRGAPYPALSARSVLADPDGTLWIGTAGDGLLRFRNGVFQAVRAVDGLAEDMVSTLLDDGHGNLWFAGDRSIHRVGRAELDAFFSGASDRVHGVAYAGNAGIPNPETSGWQALRDPDGLLWFGTFGGIVVMDPALAIDLERAAPIVHIEEVRPAEGGVYLPDRSDPAMASVRLTPGERRFDVAYTAISLRDPEAVKFRYRLDGVDADWQEVGNTNTATYTNIGAGHYTFRVQAMSGGAVQSEIATLSLSVDPFFYETNWFRALLATALLATILGAMRYRERALVAAQGRLNQLVADRTAALAEQTRRAEAARETVAAQAERLRALDRARTRFFANVSHEFRTPLTLILGPLRDLQKGRLGELPDAAQREVDVVIESGERLNVLVEQLLDIARLEVGELKLQPQNADIVPFLRRVARSFEPLSRANGIVLETALPDHAVPLVFDADRMEKVLNNLLGNAFKFTDRGGRVCLSAQLEQTDGIHGFVVRVEDDGIGIPEEALSRVFGRFYQVDDSPRRQHQGTGLGLALTRDLVQLHGGTIEVESRVGIGSTFVVRLPLAQDSPLQPRVDDDAPPDAELSADAGPPAAGGATHAQEAVEDDVRTVLLVEDNTRLRAYLRRHLEEHYRVLEAEDGQAGLEQARAVVPDLIISDVLMPVMDGQTMVESIRSDPEIDFIPIILLTAKASHDSVLEGLKGGAEDYLTKPFDIDELLLRARNIIVGRGKLRERFRTEQRVLPSLAAPTRKSDEAAAFALRVHELLAEHIDDEDFGVEELASALFLSRSSLYRRTDEVMGKSPMQVILEFRLDQAAQWLRETDVSVHEIAYGVGFKSVPHFTRRFRERFGATPSAYRQR